MPYVLCVSSRRNPMLHRTDCSHYGSRKTRGKSANVQWTSSPHQNIEGAILEACDLGKDEILSPCRDCITSEDEREMLRILASRPRR